MLEDICDEIVSCFCEESFESIIEKILVNTICDDKGFSCSTTFQSCIYSTFIVSYQNVLLDNLFLSNIPVEIPRNHIVFNIIIVLLFLILIRGLEGLIVDGSEKVNSLFALKLDVCLWLRFHILFFFIASMNLLLFTSIFLDLLNYLRLIEPQVVIDLGVIIRARFCLDE